ncbi:unnamed protein product [Ectocarpus sp. CCAP 1310/34]|nr:unnamed protein product [Ectocarpus sp. CCAP 1310/34]
MFQTDDSYDVPIDPKQQDKATRLRLTSFRRPHMRAFHFAWFGFFMAFVSWFAFVPLMKEIKGDLGMTKLEVYNANISSVSSTVLSSFIVGPLCDTFGARIISSTLLIMRCIPTAFAGVVNSATDVAIIRFFIGVMGATFVCTQFWSSQIFAKEFVGTANATTGGWGNLGGGVTQFLMVGIWNAFNTGYDSETTWRLSFVVPAAIVFCVAVGQLFLADDCPKGNYKELEAHGAMTRKSSAVSFRKGYMNVNSWLMFLQHAACFGVELTVNNVAANYFSDEFDLSTSKAGIVASLFGLMNRFARSLGGIWSDFLFAKFGGGVTGMRGRFFAQWSALLWEGCFLFLFTYMNTLDAAIPILILFSVGVQMAEGTSYGIVPYIVPDATGAVSGIVGAGGNFGAVMWGLIFRFAGRSERAVFRIIAAFVVGLSCLTALLKIRGYATCFIAPKGEPDSIAYIKDSSRVKIG